MCRGGRGEGYQGRGRGRGHGPPGDFAGRGVGRGRGRGGRFGGNDLQQQGGGGRGPPSATGTGGLPGDSEWYVLLGICLCIRRTFLGHSSSRMRMNEISGVSCLRANVWRRANTGMAASNHYASVCWW